MRLVSVSLAALASIVAFPTLLEPLAARAQSPAEPAAPAPRPQFAEHSQEELDDSDEIAALDAIRIALTEVGDGSSYVWHRGNGRLSGVIHPTASFRDQSGRVCRHIVLVLTTGPRSGRIEGIACRLGDGSWQLEG
jgi:17 kDa outer membrane surface antigen